ncbi:hypothetical protein AX15_001919 [Amanita polypyramis BW_CC]|nr:hypothetical protein AX15_001919 [Amanita polypyramis BW_CC]
MSDNRNIVIFGETGAGKSSLVNMIAGDNIAETSSRWHGCTFKSTSYSVNINSVPFSLYDTAGLNEGDEGTVAHMDAVVQLYQLLRSLETGISLLIYCLRGSRIKEGTVSNWKLFHDIICQGHVPVLLAITALENESNMDDWWSENQHFFSDHSILPNGVACITTVRGKLVKGTYRYEAEYAESHEKIIRDIQLLYLRKPFQVRPVEWFKQVTEKFIQVSYENGNCGKKVRREIEKSRSVTVSGAAAKQLVTQCQMTQAEANTLAHRLSTVDTGS